MSGYRYSLVSAKDAQAHGVQRTFQLVADIGREHLFPSQRNRCAVCKHSPHETNQALVSVNIHSHLFGGLLFCLLPLYAVHEVYPGQPNAGLADVVVFAVFFYGVAVCFLLSATYASITPATFSTVDVEADSTFSPATAPALLRLAINSITLVLFC